MIQCARIASERERIHTAVSARFARGPEKHVSPISREDGLALMRNWKTQQEEKDQIALTKRLKAMTASSVHVCVWGSDPGQVRPRDALRQTDR